MRALLLTPGSLLQAMEMESTLGLGVAAMQGAPCQSFPIVAASILRNQVRAHAAHSAHCTTMQCMQHGTVPSARCESPPKPKLRSVSDPIHFWPEQNIIGYKISKFISLAS